MVPRGVGPLTDARRRERERRWREGGGVADAAGYLRELVRTGAGPTPPRLRLAAVLGDPVARAVLGADAPPAAAGGPEQVGDAVAEFLGRMPGPRRAAAIRIALAAARLLAVRGEGQPLAAARRALAATERWLEEQALESQEALRRAAAACLAGARTARLRDEADGGPGRGGALRAPFLAASAVASLATGDWPSSGAGRIVTMVAREVGPEPTLAAVRAEVAPWALATEG